MTRNWKETGIDVPSREKKAWQREYWLKVLKPKRQVEATYKKRVAFVEKLYADAEKEERAKRRP